jgi:hypothetical protein
MSAAFVDHLFPPAFLPPFGFLGLPFGYPPPNVFLALLAAEKCSGPCKASVRAPPFLPMALAAAERGEVFLGFITKTIIQQTIGVCQMADRSFSALDSTSVAMGMNRE